MGGAQAAEGRALRCPSSGGQEFRGSDCTSPVPKLARGRGRGEGQDDEAGWHSGGVLALIQGRAVPGPSSGRGESRTSDGTHQRPSRGGEVAGVRGRGLEGRRKCSRMAWPSRNGGRGPRRGGCPRSEGRRRRSVGERRGNRSHSEDVPRHPRAVPGDIVRPGRVSNLGQHSPESELGRGGGRGEGKRSGREPQVLENGLGRRGTEDEGHAAAGAPAARAGEDERTEMPRRRLRED